MPKALLLNCFEKYPKGEKGVWVVTQSTLVVRIYYYIISISVQEFITSASNLKFQMSCLFQEGEHGLDEHKLHMYLSALQSLIPSLFALVLQNAPFASKAKLQGEVPQIEGK